MERNVTAFIVTNESIKSVNGLLCDFQLCDDAWSNTDPLMIFFESMGYELDREEVDDDYYEIKTETRNNLIRFENMIHVLSSETCYLFNRIGDSIFMTESVTNDSFWNCNGVVELHGDDSELLNSRCIDNVWAMVSHLGKTFSDTVVYVSNHDIEKFVQCQTLVQSMFKGFGSDEHNPTITLNNYLMGKQQ